MVRGATCFTGSTQRRRSGTRRWDIDGAILGTLSSGPRTASQLYRALNPRLPRAVLRRAGSREPRGLRPRVDKRAIRRHLRYLQRDGHVQASTQVKTLRRDADVVTWTVTYYSRSPARGPAPPGGTLSARLQPAVEIHNPFHGEEGAIRFIRWLRDP